ncbi:MAG: DUF4142 domain-containing protein, partial [Mesorhizobium sp.]
MKVRRLLGGLVTATAIAFALPSLAADSAQDFVDKAAVGGRFEVESSLSVLSKLDDQQVKQFAQKMIDDHGAANAKLESVAGDQKLKVPTQMDAKHKTDLEKLQSAKAPVDEPYVEMQRTAHADAVKLFESYSRDGDNAALKSFAKDTVPTLKAHQQMVEDIASKMAAGPSSTSSTTPAVNTTDTPNTGALVPGANSFTEDQARSRIQDAGYSDVSDLKKDDQGIWRGQAMKNGKSTAVGLD